MSKLTPHQRIMRAAEKGRGLRLTADEVHALSMDGAIETCATNDDEAMGIEQYEDDKPKGTR